MVNVEDSLCILGTILIRNVYKYFSQATVHLFILLLLCFEQMF